MIPSSPIVKMTWKRFLVSFSKRSPQMPTKDLLELVSETGHVGDLARLLSAFERRRTIKLGRVALIELANQTAGASYRYPNPESAVELSLAVGLLRKEGPGVSLSEAGVQFLKLIEKRFE